MEDPLRTLEEDRNCDAEEDLQEVQVDSTSMIHEAEEVRNSDEVAEGRVRRTQPCSAVAWE